MLIEDGFRTSEINQIIAQDNQRYKQITEKMLCRLLVAALIAMSASVTSAVPLEAQLAKLEATVDYATDGGDITYEVSLDHNIASGRDISATFGGDTLDVDYTDNNFEDGATWTASASVPTSDASNILDAAKLSLKRSWTW